MRKHILRRLCLVLLCLLLCCPVQVQAATKLDVNAQCSLRLSYTHQNQGLENLEISLFRVGQVFEDGSYALTEPYDSYPVAIQGITSQKEWQDTAATLWAYISADGLTPDFTQTTDAAGAVCFTGLQTGLYLISGITCKTETTTCLFDDFLLFLPNANADAFLYDVDAQPKFSQFVSNLEMVEYSVAKLWKDRTAGKNRPDSVSIDILKNGKLQESVVLSEDNSWNHNWEAPEGDRWSVVERQVPEGYTVTVSEEGTSFLVTNAVHQEDTEEPDTPQTGDTAPILLYVLLICLSGFGLLILGIALMRGKRHEKKR